MAKIEDSKIAVQIYIDFTHGRFDYEYKYIRIVSVPTHCWEDQKFYKVKDIEIRDIGPNEHDFKEIHFTVIRGRKSHRMMKIGRIVEKMGKGVDL